MWSFMGCYKTFWNSHRDFWKTLEVVNRKFLSEMHLRILSENRSEAPFKIPSHKISRVLFFFIKSAKPSFKNFSIDSARTLPRNSSTVSLKSLQKKKWFGKFLYKFLMYRFKNSSTDSFRVSSSGSFWFFSSGP